MAGQETFKTFEDFWPYYVREHSTPANRALHVVGTSGAIALAVLAGVLGRSWLWFFVPIFGYGFAWVGHFAIEKNKPATFKHPFYSLVGDFKMLSCIVTGRMGREVRKATGQSE
jgi:hypothetical protein